MFALLTTTLFGAGTALAQGDNCGTAAVLTSPGVYSANGPSTGAGAANIHCSPVSTANAINADWYTWTPAASGPVNIFQCTADTRVNVYTGSCGALTCVVGNDDDSDPGAGDCGFSCCGSSVAFVATAGTQYYIEWDDRWSTAPFTWTLQQILCTPPAATTSIVNNCGSTGDFSINVDVTSLGDATSVTVSDGGLTTPIQVFGTGIVTMGPYASGASVTITLIHDQDNGCNVILPTVNFTCPVIINTFPYCETYNSFPQGSTSCGAAITLPAASGWLNVPGEAASNTDWTPDALGTPSSGTGPSDDFTGGGFYLYVEATGCSNRTADLFSPNFDVSSFAGDARMNFQFNATSTSPSPSGSITVDVEDPAFSGNWVTLGIFGPFVSPKTNGWESTGNLDYTPSGLGDLRYRVRQVTSPSFWDMAIDEFCVSEASCTQPTATATTSAQVCGATDFTVDVDITDLGDGAPLDITVNGVPQGLAINAIGIQTVGPFPQSIPVTIGLVHASDASCDIALGSYVLTNPPIQVAPWCEDWTLATSACNSTLQATLPNGWTTTGPGVWTICNGVTGSANTGPTNSGLSPGSGGNYIYTEGSGSTGLRTLTSACLDVSGLTQPNLNFWYHQFGTGMANGANIQVEIEDPALSGIWAPAPNGLLNGPSLDQWQFYTENLTVTGTSIRVRFIGFSPSFDSDMALDDICVVEAPTCTTPTVVYTVVDDCANLTWSVDVDVQSLGDAPSLDLVSDALGLEYDDIAAPGIYTMGPYCISDASVNIDVVHNGDPIFCSVSSTESTGCASPCAPNAPTSAFDTQTESIILAGNTTTINVANQCTGNQGPLGLQSLICSQEADVYQNFTYNMTVDFGTCGGNFTNRGAVWVDWNGDGVFDTATEEVYTYCQINPPPGLTVIPVTIPASSNLGRVIMRVQQQEGAPTCPTPLNPCGTFSFGSRYDVALNIQPTPPCSQPTAALTAVADCQNAQYSIDVDLTSLGDASTVDIVSDVNGVEFAGVNATGIYNIGPFPDASAVNVSITHNDNALCSVNLPPFTFECAPSDFCAGYTSAPGIPIPPTGTGGGGTPPTEDIISTGPLNGEAIVGLDVVVELTHTFVGDLEIHLISPQGTDVIIWDNLCGGFDNMEVRFSDGSPAPVCANNLVATIGPSQPLSTFNTEQFEGDWTLRIFDLAGGDSGTLIQWCLLPVLQIPDCPNPTNLAVTAVTETTATLDWTVGDPGNTDYTIEYGPAGFTLGTGLTVSGTLPPPVTVVGLSGSTTYDFYVSEDCPAGTSLQVGPATGTTLTVITTFPYCNDFEVADGFPSTCATGCTIPCAFPIATGWSQDDTDGMDWIIDVGGTSSTGTGPSIDRVPGTSTGRYVYTETSGCTNITAVMTSPSFDVSSMVNDPILGFSYHMFGATMGTLTVEVEDPAGSNNWTTVFVQAGQDQTSNAAPWTDIEVPLPALTGTQFAARFTGLAGTSFTSDMALDHICVTEGPCQFPQFTYNVVCNPDTTFNVEVTLTDVGTGPVVDITANVSSAGVDTILGADGTGNPYVLGPFAGLGTEVDLFVQNPAIPGCEQSIFGLGCPPPNDDCFSQNPSDNPVSVGTTIAFSGIVDGSSVDPAFQTIFPGIAGLVWHAVEVTECVDLFFDYCGSTPVWGNGSQALFADCNGTTVNPDGNNFNTTDCGDNNFTIFFLSVPPGQYYYPVFWDPANNAQGLYTLNLNAFAPSTPCSPNTCADAEPIACGGIAIGTTASNTPSQDLNNVCLPNHIAPGQDAWYVFTNLVPNSLFAAGDGATNTFDLNGPNASVNSVVLSQLGQVLATGDGTSDTYDLTPGVNANVGQVLVDGVPQAAGGSPTNDLELTINTDQFGGETTWNIVDNGTTATIASGGPYSGQNNTTIVTPINAVPAGSYTFTIFDSFGDGICCAYGAGSYSLQNLTTATTIATGGAFLSSEATAFTITPVGADYYVSSGTGPGGVDQVVFLNIPGPGTAIQIDYTSDVTLSDPADYTISVGTGLGGVDQLVLTTAPLVGETLTAQYGLLGGDQLVTASTCVGTTYNSILTIYEDQGGCGNLVCITGNDNNCGQQSEVNWLATAGSTYYIVVSGPAGFLGGNGDYTLSVTCAPPCTPQPNDVCGGALGLTPVLADGTGVPDLGDNTCSFADANPSCDITGIQAGRAQGVWYTWTTDAVTVNYDLTLLDFDEDPTYTSTALSYVLYTGPDCATLTEVACNLAGEGTNSLPVLDPNTTYWLMVFNDGGVGIEGTFGILLEFPPANDASIAQITYPDGLVCTQQIIPEVELVNNGVADLTSVDITYQIDGGAPVVFNWTGNLAYQASELVELPVSAVAPGPHTIDAFTSNPNGVADEVPANDAAPQNLFDATGQEVTIVVRTDNFGGETTWDLYDSGLLTPIASGGPYAGQNNTVITETLCLPVAPFQNCFYFIIFDSFGDGICCGFGQGFWQIRNSANETLLGDIFHGGGTAPDGTPVADGDQSPAAVTASPGYGDATGYHSFCLPVAPIVATADIEDTECGIFTNTLQNKVYCDAVAGATDYQFQFSDPDAGFVRNIAVFGRRWVAFSEMQTSPLIPGTHYFVRARADDPNGFPGFFFDDVFGSGCETGIDPVLVPGCTQLIDDPSLPTNSCGGTYVFNGSDRVWAYPVVGATQYRFRFQNPGEGFIRQIARPSYVCLLNWFTLPLTPAIYDVDVNVLVNGQWGGYCGAACPITIVPAPSNLAGRDLGEQTMTGVSLWPNPVRDGNVNLSIEGLTLSEQRITVDLYDMFGKRVLADSYEIAGEVFNATLEVDGLAAGIYMAHINTEEGTHIERISVQ